MLFGMSFCHEYSTLRQEEQSKTNIKAKHKKSFFHAYVQLGQVKQGLKSATPGSSMVPQGELPAGSREHDRKYVRAHDVTKSTTSQNLNE